MNSDKEFFDNYWDEYKKLIINERDDSQIISFRDAINLFKMLRNNTIYTHFWP